MYSKIRKTWSFHVVVWQRTVTKCTKIYNARAHVLVNPFLWRRPFAVVVVVCLSSLIMATTAAFGEDIPLAFRGVRDESKE